MIVVVFNSELFSFLFHQEDDVESSDFEVNYDYFYERYWEKLAYRIPAFECLKVSTIIFATSRFQNDIFSMKYL